MPPFEFLGPYRIGEPLGRGGMGTVYRAVHEKTKEPVAVKLIAAQVADEMRFRRRFEAEVTTLQRLRHEGIVRIIGYGEEEGQLFYSMELVEGESLQARIKREKKIDWMATIDIAIEVCAALKHAHDIGVIHRDLKPANLILTQNNHVKLVDFGIAKIFGDDAQHTVVGSVLGTADYMAPEQITSSGITVRTDLYALGSLTYAMLVGRAPFSGKSTTAVMESLKRNKPVPLDMIDPELPEALVELIHQLLEKDPADRPPTALAVMNRLKAMRAGLQRAQTLLGEESPTEIRPSGTPLEEDSESFESLSSSDTSPTGVQSSGDAVTNLSEEATQVRRRSGEHTDATNPSVAIGGAAPSGRKKSPTEVSDTRRSKTLPPGGSKKESKSNDTHFQTVNESDSRHTSNRQDDGNSWTQVITIAGMLAVLAGGAVLFLRAMQPPSADELYVSATDLDDTGAKKAFLKAFPDDDRAAEVRDLLVTDQVRGAMNRMRAQAGLGVTPLLLIEEAFLAAMKERDQNPQEASNQLQSWLDLFDTEANRSDPKLSELIELAEHERARLMTAEPGGQQDRRVEELMQQIKLAVSLEDADEARKRLRGIVETFGGQPWADSAVERATQAIAELQR